ncbi:TPA: Rpn family recombination-promoting nuclease/putative transposase [Escherichia coli]|nr:Rpn family recombination-promoting nuclease/putative transposase [Escherichia coli]
MRASQPGKMPGFFVSRSRENSMTIAERLEQKGALEKALAIARQLQKMGMTPEQIKQATGLSEAELKKVIH